MCPTEILAQQHFATLSKLFGDAKIDARTILFTASDKGRKRMEKLAAIADGSARIIVGTHSLFQGDVEFSRLFLCVIDEQHKFGVEQRSALCAKGKTPPHILSMTATPIPRTLAMTSFGDMDISTIDQLPPGRKSVETFISSMSKADEIARALAAKMQGEPRLKAYWICPLVNESDKLELSAVKAREEALRAVFGDALAIAHGQISAEESEAALADFASANGRARVLLATTIVEVGVNVPEASAMVIEHAERFGLSTLHQLRGRVGRGAEKSRCILLHAEKTTPRARERLSIMRATNDGFAIAEEDLRLRGAGDIAGVKQSGDVDFRFADANADPLLIPRAREEARRLVREDPALASENGREARELMRIFGYETERETWTRKI